MRARIALSLLLPLTAASCASSIAELQNSPNCHVWASVGLGDVKALVTETATVTSYSVSADAAWTGQGTLRVDSPGQIRWVGEYAGGSLKLQRALGRMSADVYNDGAILNFGLATRRMHANTKCSQPQIALGAAALLVAIQTLQSR